jgi:hypothetical protein
VCVMCVCVCARSVCSYVRALQTHTQTHRHTPATALIGTRAPQPRAERRRGGSMLWQGTPRTRVLMQQSQHQRQTRSARLDAMEDGAVRNGQVRQSTSARAENTAYLRKTTKNNKIRVLCKKEWLPTFPPANSVAPVPKPSP